MLKYRYELPNLHMRVILITQQPPPPIFLLFCLKSNLKAMVLKLLKKNLNFIGKTWQNTLDMYQINWYWRNWRLNKNKLVAKQKKFLYFFYWKFVLQCCYNIRFYLFNLAYFLLVSSHLYPQVIWWHVMQKRLITEIVGSKLICLFEN